MTDVSDKPLLVMVDLFPSLLTAGDTSNAQYKSISDSLLVVLPELKTLAHKVWEDLNGITPDLQTPLGELFNNAWSFQWLKQQANLANIFQSMANGSGGSSVSNVTCVLPPLGTVDAVVAPSSPPTLFLSFILNGGYFHFYSGPLGAGWKLDFDLSLVVTTPVPPTPFNFTPTVTAQFSNAQMHADNVGASLDEGFDDLITAIGNFFTGGTFISDVDWEMQLVEQETDNAQQTVPQSTAAPLESIFTMLNAATPDVAQAGFTECAFEVTNNQLVLTVTHPLDPGPVIEDSNNLPPPFFKVPATLSADASQTVPGAQITLVGFNFPVDTSTQLELQWVNTSSGAPTGAEIRYNNQTYQVAAPAPVDGVVTYAYTTGALPAGQPVTFEARCGDEVSWSKWSDPFVDSTATTGLADIQLVPAQGAPSAQSFDLGSKPLSKTSGNFADAVTIPANAPPGAYNLVASTAGQQIAETPIMIVSILAPVVDVIDPVTGIVEDAPLFGGMPFTLRGEAFPDGPVTVAINGATVATPTAVNGMFTVPLTTPGNQWTVGIFPLTATSGAATATLNPPIDLEGAPQ